MLELGMERYTKLQKQSDEIELDKNGCFYMSAVMVKIQETNEVSVLMVSEKMKNENEDIKAYLEENE